VNGLYKQLHKSLIATLVVGTLSLAIAHLPEATAASQTEIQYRRAQQLINHKHVAEGQQILIKLCQSPSAPVEALGLLAFTFLAEESTITDEHLIECEKLANRAIRKDPEWGTGYKILAQVSNLQSKPALALSQSTKALSVKKPEIKAYLQRCLAYEALGKHKEALSDITIYTETHDSSADMFNLKGSILVSMKRYDDAIAAYRMSLKKQFRDWTIFRIVDCFEQQHQYDKAADELSRLIKVNAADAEAYQTRGRMLGLAKHYKAAIEDYTMAIKLEPNGRFYKERAALYKLTGKQKEAAEDLRKASIEDKSQF
jgi:tetratricopeptide (TPR) repeat protein